MRTAPLVLALMLASPLVVCPRTQAIASAQPAPASFEQAERLIDEIERTLRDLERTGADLSVLFGIPSDAERALVLDAGLRIVDLASRAEKMIKAAVEAADREDDADVEQRDTLITNNAGQVPIRLARGALLAASAMPNGAERDEHFERANKAITRVRTISGWLELETITLLGIEALLHGKPLSAIKHFDEARGTLAGADPSEPLALEFTPAVTLGLVRATLEGRGWSAAQTAQRTLTARPPFETTGSPDPALAVVLTDVRFAIQAARGEAENTRSSRASVLAQAFANYDDLAQTLLRTGLDAQQAWRIACAQANEAMQPWMERGSLPPVALAGLSFALMDAEKTSAEGIDLARDAMADTLGVNKELHNLAALQLMRSLGTSDSVVHVSEACAIAARLSVENFGDVRSQEYEPALAVRILEMSAQSDDLDTAIRSLRRTSETGAGERLPLWRTYLATALTSKGDEPSLREAITVLGLIDVQGTPNTVNMLRTAKVYASLFFMTRSTSDATDWLASADRAVAAVPENAITSALNQRALALLALDRAEDALVAAQSAWEHLLDARNPILVLECASAVFEACRQIGEVAPILAILERVPAESSMTPTLHTRAHEIVHARIRETSTHFLSEESRDLSDDARILSLISSRLDPQADLVQLSRLQHDAAIAFILSGEPERALETILAITERAGKSADRLHLQAEARLAVRDDAGAFADLRTLAGATEANSSTTDLYWYAWARMVEILDRRNTNGDRTPTILREITRLRATDGYDFCAECAERIEAVATKLGTDPMR